MDIQGQSIRSEINGTSAELSTTQKDTEETSTAPQMKVKPDNTEKTEKDVQRTYKGRRVLKDSEDDSEESSNEKRQPSRPASSSQASEQLPSSYPTLESRSSGEPEKSQGSATPQRHIRQSDEIKQTGPLPGEKDKLHQQTTVDAAMEFCMAIIAGDLDKVERLLGSGASVNQVQADGTTPLCSAAVNGHTEVAALLLANGAAVNQALNGGVTPLFLAAYKGHTEVAALLVKNGAAINIVLDDGTTPLWNAAKNGYTKFVALLLKNGAAVDQADAKGVTPLWIAAQNGHTEIAELLLTSGAAINQANAKGTTPLWIAAKNGHTALVALLLKHGAAVNQTNANGVTPLWVAAESGHAEIAESLLSSGAAINQAMEDGITPLWTAAQHGHTKLVALLLKHGAALNQSNAKGNTPLWIAAQNGHTALVALLLKHGAAVNQTNANVVTPLWIAAQNGHTEMVELLLKCGADIKKARIGGATPLWVAAQKGHANVVSVLLLKNESDRAAQGWIPRGLQFFDVPYIDTPSLQGKTPLHIAIENGHFVATSVLIAAKADLNLPDRDGNTPLLLAVASKDLSVVTLLLQAGAEVGPRNKAGQTALALALATSPPHSLIIDQLIDTTPSGQQVTGSADQKIDMTLLTERAHTLLMTDQHDDAQQATLWKTFTNTLCTELGLRHIVAEGLAAMLRQMPPLWPGPNGKAVKPTAAQVRQFIRHMLVSAQRLHELSNENDPNRAAYYDAPQALPAAAKLIGVALGQSRQVMADAEAALRGWEEELETLLTSLVPTTSTADIKSTLQQQIGLHPLLADAIASLWDSLKNPKSTAELMQAMQRQFNTPEFIGSVIEAGNSDALRFMLMEQIKALTKR